MGAYAFEVMGTVTSTGSNVLTMQYTTASASNTLYYMNLPPLHWIDSVPLTEVPWGAWAEQQATQVAQNTWNVWTHEVMQGVARGANVPGGAYLGTTPGPTVTTAAQQVAEELLREHLNPSQLREMEESKCFTVHSRGSKRRYRIKTNMERHGNVEVLDENNRAIASLCCAPGGAIPIADALLGQKLMLEYDEAEFLAKANRTELRRTA